MKTLYVTHESDKLGKTALAILEKLGCLTQTLRGKEGAPEASIAFFTDSHSGYWPHRHTRMAVHRQEKVPEWAGTTPLRVALRQHGYGSFERAIVGAAYRLERWLRGMNGDTPWGMGPKSEEYAPAYQSWLSSLGIRRGLSWEISPGLWPTKVKQGQLSLAYP